MIEKKAMETHLKNKGEFVLSQQELIDRLENLPLRYSPNFIRMLVGEQIIVPNTQQHHNQQQQQQQQSSTNPHIVSAFVKESLFKSLHINHNERTRNFNDFFPFVEEKMRKRKKKILCKLKI